MKRKIYKDLLEWKNEKNKKPLMVFGARQVGKTYIINEFCLKEYKNYIYINLFRDKTIINLYKDNKKSDDTYITFKNEYKFEENEDTIIFVDEVQESPEFIEELKYLCEVHNNLNIIVAGSLLGIKLKRCGLSFPVGKVWMIDMFPMDFEEFLLAIKGEDIINMIKSSYKNNKPLGEGIHNMLLTYYKYFLITGGMPDSVNNLLENNLEIMKYDSNTITSIISSYFNDMGKYVTNNSETIKILSTYKSIPYQLANKSNKFQYSKITNGAKSREYELPIDWLLETNLTIKCNLVKTPEIPLKGFIDITNFKLYMSDTGILNVSLNITKEQILEDKIGLYKGAVTENYVANQLLINDFPLYYWESSGEAEVDFLITTNDGVIPIEVKAADNTKSKSLKIYTEKYKPKYSIKISTKNFGFDKRNNIKSVPLYAVFCIKENTD